MFSRKTKGFTLIELLVVIAIIAILAAILFPVFAKAREKARQSQCMSNMKNTALALRMYSSDYDERLPQGMPANLLGWPNNALNASAPAASRCRDDYTCGWTFEAQAYIKNSQVLLCPNWNRVTLVGTAGAITAAATPSPAPCSVLSATTGLCTTRAATTLDQFWPTTYMLSSSLVGASESEISNASNKAMTYEALPFHHDTTVTTANFVGGNNAKGGMLVIVGFADGHAKVQNMNQAMPNSATVTCNLANKWNLNAGWSSATITACTLDGTALGITGRQGSNF